MLCSKLRLLTAAIACGACLATAATQTFAQSYPTRPIKLIVPLTPGGPADRAARLLAQRLGEAFKQPVIVESKSGAGSMLGANFVAKSAPDGYTLLICNQASISLGPMVSSNTPYDPMKDFTHIALIGSFPIFFMVRADHPAKSFQELLSMAKAKPGSISHGFPGGGSIIFLMSELLKQNGGVKLLVVFYKGAAPAIADLLGGHIDATYIADSSAGEFVRSGKLRMLATTTEKRVPGFPDVPAINEIVPGVYGSLWYGVSAPATTPQAVIDRLQAEILTAINSADIRTALTGIGMTPAPLGSGEFVGFIHNEMSKWGPIIKANNIRVD